MRVGGYAVIVGPDAPTKEWDTITCAHCNRIVRCRTDPGGFCRCCMKPLCGPCADKGVCTPFEARLDAYEKRERFRRQLSE